jgi:hypothetical protein
MLGDDLQITSVNADLLARVSDDDHVQNMLVGHGVSRAVPMDEAILSDDAVTDFGGIVRAHGQWGELIALLIKALDGRLPRRLMHMGVAHLGHPPLSMLA